MAKSYRIPSMMWLQLTPGVQGNLRIEYDGQVFDLIEIEPYVRKDGEDSWVVRWGAECQTCSTPFVSSSPLRVRSPIRKCQRCRDAARKRGANHDRD